jgi:hypothetical protein
MRAIMAETKTCPDCGAQLSADAPEGFCPQCPMAAGEAGPSQAGETPSRIGAAAFPSTLVVLEPITRSASGRLHRWNVWKPGIGVKNKSNNERNQNHEDKMSHHQNPYPIKNRE